MAKSCLMFFTPRCDSTAGSSTALVIDTDSLTFYDGPAPIRLRLTLAKNPHQASSKLSYHLLHSVWSSHSFRTTNTSPHLSKTLADVANSSSATSTLQAPPQGL